MTVSYAEEERLGRDAVSQGDQPCLSCTWDRYLLPIASDLTRQALATKYTTGWDEIDALVEIQATCWASPEENQEMEVRVLQDGGWEWGVQESVPRDPWKPRAGRE